MPRAHPESANLHDLLEIIVNWVIFVDVFFPSATCRATFLNTAAIFRSRFLRPASLVYSEIILENTLPEIETCLGWRPFSSICFGIRYLSDIFTLSSSVYPERVMISIRSRRAGGMGSETLAVAINMTRERSKGMFR